MEKAYVSTDGAPRPRGHYAQAVRVGNMIFVSGQLPVIPGADETKFPEGMEAQALQVLRNVRAVLEEAGSSLSDVVNVQVLIPSNEYWAPFNDVYKRMMGANKPARTVIRGGELPIPGILLEMTVMAVTQN
ncbi:RidA family protein [Allomesorhizobium camelthorni]|uniref:RidA family protein n=1 Tax=Allomesorhizobium camelthorni TaxID=475069 RepID=A0A6G4WF68_9HYPH|nr:RidA family protein [Mesorhizobium camelthorni]NGO53455.1 RidA family protein [Mesorhizobium camelthorni]